MSETIDANNQESNSENVDKFMCNSIDEGYVISCILQSADDRLKKEIINLLSSYFASKFLAPSSSREAFHSLEKFMVKRIKQKYPESFTGNFFR